MGVDKSITTNIDVEKLSLDENESTTSSNDFKAKINIEKHGITKRGLNARHVNLMIISQSVGSGLFISIKTPLVTSGSLGFFIAFAIWAFLVVYPLMQAVGILCCWLPIKGSFVHFSGRYVDTSLGFATSIIYIYTTMMFVCLEATAVAQCISYWTNLNPGVWITICIVLYVLMGLVGVNYYGEIEFFTGIMKIFLIVGLMLFSLISMCGGNPKGDAYGFKNWHPLFKPYLVEGNTGKFLAFWNSLLWAAFAAGGADNLALIAGEVINPRKNIAMAAKRSYIRIYLFYIGGIFFLNSLISANSPLLLDAIKNGGEGAAGSPWVIGIKSVGVKGLDSLINALIMSSAFSCGNAFFYCSTRSIYSAAIAGYLPRFFGKCLKNGAPVYCVMLTFAVSLLSYLNVSNSGVVVFNWFVNLCATGLICAYLCIFWSYFNFRKAWEKQNNLKMKHPQYPYYLGPKFLHPILTYTGLIITILVLFFNGFWIFFPGNFNASNFLTSYFAPIFLVCLFLFWKILKRTKFKTSLTADITTDKKEIDEEEEAELQELENIPKSNNKFMNFFAKINTFLFD
ncbi:PUT4 [Candida jiufengensis]|uniref:PUT4 n=1 Tax=Candida jiufengensis TaxID=497108 RepID=UPI00222516B8|nr:PUT4 [Candida jiufengensis]KAI5953352.1 PUT4 [Candida jiufengensis]